MKARLTLERMKAGFFEICRGFVEVHSYHSRNPSIVRKNVGRKREKEKKQIGEKKAPCCDHEIRECTPRERASIHLLAPPQACRERAIGAVDLRQNAQITIVDCFRWNDAGRGRLERPFRILRQKGFDLKLVFFRLQ